MPHTIDLELAAAEPRTPQHRVGPFVGHLHLVYIRPKDSTGFDGMESLEDLRRNWNRLLDAAGLTDEERREAVRLFHERAARVPGTEA